VKSRSGTRLVDPKHGIDAVTTLYIAAGRVAAIGAAPAQWHPNRTIDAAGSSCARASSISRPACASRIRIQGHGWSRRWRLRSRAASPASRVRRHRPAARRARAGADAEAPRAVEHLRVDERRFRCGTPRSPARRARPSRSATHLQRRRSARRPDRRAPGSAARAVLSICTSPGSSSGGSVSGGHARLVTPPATAAAISDSSVALYSNPARAGGREIDEAGTTTSPAASIVRLGCHCAGAAPIAATLPRRCRACHGVDPVLRIDEAAVLISIFTVQASRRAAPREPCAPRGRRTEVSFGGSTTPPPGRQGRPAPPGGRRTK